MRLTLAIVMGTKKRILFAEGEQISNMEYMITSRLLNMIQRKKVDKLSCVLVGKYFRNTEFAKEGGKFGSLT